jgi:hypothetical protein
MFVGENSSAVLPRDLWENESQKNSTPAAAALVQRLEAPATKMLARKQEIAE